MSKQRGFMLASMLVLICVASIAMVCALLYAAMRDYEEWEAFRTTHSCKVVTRVNGSVMPSVGVSTSGKMVVGTTITPDRTGWLCDDGVTYYR